MNLSNKGLALICEFEGYHTALPDGGCTAYRCPAGVLTIGFGCTEGVAEGMIWTRQQAEEALRRELAKHERIVTRLVTVDMTQGQFDSLVSFSYNCGGLEGSTLLRKLNRGDVIGASNEFRHWTKATVKGTKVQLPGLVRRRKAEAALFVSDLPGAAEMPQAAVQSAPMSRQTVATVATAASGIVATGANQATTSSPPKVDVSKALAKGQEVRQTVEQAKDLGAWAKGFGGWAMTGEGAGVLMVMAIGTAALLMWARRSEG